MLLLSMLATLVLVPPASLAETVPPLPQPLSLLDALRVGAEGMHPDILFAQAQKMSAQAGLEQAEGNYALDASLNLGAYWIEPSPVAIDQSDDDHNASLNIRKPLYDFGYTGELVAAAESAVEANEDAYQYARHRHQIEIARRFFDVILSDLKYAWDDEAMAIGFVRMDAMRDRHALKRISDVELLSSENTYQKTLTARRTSEITQRVSRQLLAETINRPDELAAELVTPGAGLVDKALPELDALIDKALNKNLNLAAQRRTVLAANKALNAARKRWRPRLDAEIEVSEYSRDLASREDWRAGFNLNIPLYENELLQSGISKKRADWQIEKARLMQLQTQLRQQIYKSWLRIQSLNTKTAELKVAEQRAERELDKSRGEYELELRTNLGDSLVNTSRVRYERAKNDFELVLAWMNLALLSGDFPEAVIANMGEAK